MADLVDHGRPAWLIDGISDCCQSSGADPEVLLPGGTAFVAEFRQTHYIFLHCRRYTFICIKTRQY